MFKKIAVALGVVASLGLILWLALGRDPSAPLASSGEEVATGEVAASSPSADATTPGIEAPTIAVDAVETHLATLDLGVGQAGIEGVVTGVTGGVAAGAEVCLYRTHLAPDLEADEGLALWQLYMGDDSARGFGPPFLSGAAERRPIHQRYRDILERVARVTTDEAGNYAFRGLGAGRYVVAARAVDSLDTPSRRVSYLGDTTEDVDIALAAGAEVQGVVVDPRGEAVAGAVVTADGQLWRVDRPQDAFLSLYDLFVYVLNPVRREVVATATGTFRIAGLPALEYRLTASASPWADGSIVHSVTATEHVEVPLREAAMLVGEVGSDRGPLAGVTVQLTPAVDLGGGRGIESMVERFLAVPLEATSDGDGVFRFERLVPGRYDLAASAPAHQSEIVRALDASPGEVTQVSVSLEAGAILEGVVHDPSGRPIAGAEVRPRLETGRRGGPADFMAGMRGGRGARGGDLERTGADGRFRFDTLAPGEYTLDVRHDEWVRQSVRAKTGEAAIEVTLEPGFAAQGLVVDEFDAPISGARVRVEKSRGVSQRAVTGSDGTFRLAGLEDGTYALTVQGQNRLTLRDSIEAIDGDLGVIVLPPAVTLAGIVFDPNGAPLAGARVQAIKQSGAGADTDVETGTEGRRGGRGESAQFVRVRGERGAGAGGLGFGRQSVRASAWTSADGAFVIRLPEADGDWRLTASHPGLESATIDSLRVAGVPVDGLTLRLAVGASLYGQVLAVDGVPVANASLSLRPTGEGFGMPTMTRSEVDGSYRFLGGLSAGEYELRAQASGFAATTIGAVSLSAGQATSLNVSLERERVIRGIVVADAGGAVAGATVIARGPDERLRPVVSDPDGRFEIVGLGVAQLEVIVRAEGYQTWRRSDVATDVGELRVVLEPSYALSGWVLDAETREPVAGANLVARNLDAANAPEEPTDRAARAPGLRLAARGATGRGRSADDGSFRLDELAAGTWSLTVEADGFVGTQLEGLLVPGGTVEVLLDPGARIRGRVTDRDGAPIQGAQVRVTTLTAEPEDAATTPASTARPRPRTNRPVGRGTTDENGAYVVSGIPTGLFRVLFEHTEYEPVQRDGVLVAPGADSPEVDEVMPNGGVITGRARLASGSTGVLVLQGGEPSVVRYHDLEDGFEYRFAGLSPGSYTLRYRTSMRRGDTLSEIQFAVEGQRTQRVDLPAP
ncbi:MAG: carboxypeptidase regulatory-like domain-containing protein [Planctomycetota bacterium]